MMASVHQLQPWVVLALVTAITAMATPLLIVYANRGGLYDKPGERRSHEGIIPRGGGAVAVLAVFPAIMWLEARYHWSIALLPPLAAIALIGWLDDHQPQSVGRRLLVQMGSAVWLWWHLSTVAMIQIGPWTLNIAALWPLLAVLTSIWLINLYNFMDGSHGLAAGEAIFVGLAALFLLAGHAPAAATTGGLLGAAMLGFLPWNYPQPRIFMGDVASGVLGLMVAAMTLLATPRVWCIPLILSAVFIVDATMTLFDRIRRRQVWHSAHREHLYQRLIRAGWSHQKVWLSYMLVNLLFILPMAVLAVIWPRLALPLLLLLCVLLALVWLWAVHHLRRYSSSTGSAVA